MTPNTPKAPPSEVGYGKPPVHTRFRKGQSGNPSGRRRLGDAERVSRLFWQEILRPLTLREGDKITKVRALRAVFRSQVASAVKGNVAAQRAVFAAARELAEDSRSRCGAGTAEHKLANTIDEMSDEELMALVQTAAK
jgi:Family of unknown function (DUF5681)